MNVWLALTVDTHVHYRRCHVWFDTLGPGDAAFCRVTQMGLLRHLTTPAIMNGEPLTQREAWAIDEGILALPETTFLSDPGDLLEENWKRLTNSSRASHRAWTDAYLAAFAETRHLTLLTLDASLARTSPNHLLLR